MNIKTVFIIVTLVFISFTVTAEPTLWKIASDKAEIYLFGSIHVGKTEMYPLSKQINTAFTNSEHLVLEIDMLSPSMVASVAMMYLNATLPDNQTLDNIMTTEQLNKLHSVLKTYNLPYSSMANIKPWLIGMNLQMLMMTTQQYQPELGVDIHFAQRALATRKNVIELESASEQFAYFDNLTMQQQVRFLIGSLEQIDTGAMTINSMMRYWLNGDQKEFEKLIMADFTGSADEQFFYDIFLKQRNIKMAHKIAAFLETGSSYFVVVGAAHYIGEDSIIQNLQKKGIKVIRVN